MIHTAGGQQVGQRGLGAAPREFPFERGLRGGGALDVGGRDAVDVRREDSHRRQSPKRRDEHEAPVRARRAADDLGAMGVPKVSAMAVQKLGVPSAMAVPKMGVRLAVAVQKAGVPVDTDRCPR